MVDVFKDFEYIIQQGKIKSMPSESKLLILGQMHYAMKRGDLTVSEIDALEKILGVGIGKYKKAIEFALFGEADEAA
jgi:hypothetical protein